MLYDDQVDSATPMIQEIAAGWLLDSLCYRTFYIYIKQHNPSTFTHNEKQLHYTRTFVQEHSKMTNDYLINICKTFIVVPINIPCVNKTIN